AGRAGRARGRGADAREDQLGQAARGPRRRRGAGDAGPRAPLALHRRARARPAARAALTATFRYHGPMPIYEFVCESCGGLVERRQNRSAPPPDACPECGGKMAKIMSRNSFQLKGGGWYRDLYSSGSGSSNSSPSTESKPAPATESQPAAAESKPASPP